MKSFTTTLIIVLCIASSALAYDITQLMKDMQTYHEKRKTEFSDLTIKMEGSFTADKQGSQNLTSAYYMKGGKWRNDSDMGQLKTTMLFDGSDYWSVAMGMKMKMSKEDVASKSAGHSFWQESLEDYTISGDETVSGRDCWVLEAKDKPKLWVDKKTFITVASEFVASGKNMRVVQSDFRTVKGDFEIPYHSETTSDGKKSIETDVTKLETNTGLSDDLFDASKLGGSSMGAAPSSGMSGGQQMNLQNINIDSLMKAAEEMKKQYEQQNKGN